MRKSPWRSRTPVHLSASLNQQLNFYALAASAAGVSLLALAQPAEAKIIYTKTHQVIAWNGIYGLDLNHDGTMDFIIWNRSHSLSSVFCLSAKEAYGNAVEGSGHSAAALIKGSPIGPNQNFIVTTSSCNDKMVAVPCIIEGGCGTAYGPWANVSNGYLGLKFLIDGKTHYGWARLSVAVQNDTITATVTGYAYETVANKTIRAGQTYGGADTSSAQLSCDAAISAVSEPDGPQPASLAQLARGAQRASSRRRP